MSEHLKIVQARLNTAAQATGIENDYPEVVMEQKITQDEKRLQILQEELKKAEEVITFLRSQMASLQARTRQSYSPINSEEEEELVNRETAWLLPKYNNKRGAKKRKATSSPEQSPTKQNVEQNKTKTPKDQKPPLVVISNVDNYQEIKNWLQRKNLKYNAILMNNNQLKINVNSETEYRELTKTMNEGKQQWHTYENIQDRPIRIMVRDMHPTYDTEAVSYTHLA